MNTQNGLWVFIIIFTYSFSPQDRSGKRIHMGIGSKWFAQLEKVTLCKIMTNVTLMIRYIVLFWKQLIPTAREGLRDFWEAIAKPFRRFFWFVNWIWYIRLIIYEILLSTCNNISNVLCGIKFFDLVNRTIFSGVGKTKYVWEKWKRWTRDESWSWSPDL